MAITKTDRHKTILLPLIYQNIVFTFFCFLSISFLSHAADTIGPQQVLKINQTLVSEGEVFELGFFTDGFSGSYYLGIWFKADKKKKPMWVANRESPILDTTGNLRIRSDGNLILIDQRQVPWFVNSGKLSSNPNTTAILLDSGNFVLRQEQNSIIIWESFDYPTDTLLPGMKIGLFGLNTTQSRFQVLVSWVSPQNPNRGSFTLGFNNSPRASVSVWRGVGVHMDIGFWKDGEFRFIFENDSNGYYNFSRVITNSDAYFSFNGNGHNVSKWFVISSTGNLDEYSMSSKGNISSVSHRLCEDSQGGNTGKCLTSIPFSCKDGDNFSQINGTMASSFFVMGSFNMEFSDCQFLCRSNCSCSAFASLEGDQTGCQIYYGNKNDLWNIVDKGGGGVVFVRGKAPKESGGGKNWWKILLAIIGPVSFALFLTLIFLYCYRQRKKNIVDGGQNQGNMVTGEEVRLFRTGSNISPIHEEIRGTSNIEIRRRNDQDLPLFSFSSIESATNYFAGANKLGEGGFGPVYKGRLQNGQEIAVKRLSKISRQGLEEFKNEVTLISKLQHRNLVRLLGCCIEAEESILVYEYMPNRSLDSFIFDSKKRVVLDWRKRLSIIEGIAQGLLYLHKYSRLRIIHRDLKTSNILLDIEMNPKISDFGMARIFKDSDTRVKTNKVVGTYGYMSPEYAMDGLFSEKSDVFSFGVILLEIISGNKNIAFFEADHSLNLLGKAWNLWRVGDYMKFVDSTMQGCCSMDEAARCIQLGLLCVQERANDRPAMSEIVTALSNQSFVLQLPKEPAFFSQLSSTDAESSSSRKRLSKNDLTISEVYAR